MDVGFLNNLMIEKNNDGFEYPTIGTAEEFRKL